MSQRIGLVTLLVLDYDEALAYYIGVLEFELIEDVRIDTDDRWVVVAPRGESGCRIVLARAASDNERKAVGNQAGDRVFLFLWTDDFDRSFAAYTQRGVTFLESPRYEPYGIVAVFTDLYGNRWDLIEPAAGR